MRYVFNLIANVYSEVCHLTKFKGKEDELTAMKITGMKYTSICPNILRKFTKLKKLTITETSIDYIPPDIGYLYDLEELHYVSNTSIGSSEDVSILGELEKLKVLNFSNNSISEIPECLRSQAYSNNEMLIPMHSSFTSLRVLNLSENDIIELPNTLFTLVQLEKLDVSNNIIDFIPSEIALLANLKTLHVQTNKIDYIPDSICYLISLKVFNASDNDIDTLPDSFYKLTTLRKLNISKNSFTELSAKIVFLKKLSHLDISYNMISTYVSGMYSMSNLIQFTASNNKINVFAEYDELPQNLFYLDLSSNGIDVLPDLGGLLDLHECNISNNNLQKLPSAIGNFKYLHTLNASSNCLEKLPDCFGNLCTIVHLFLQNNNLSVLPLSFSKLENITFLDLGSNSFTKIPQEIFSCKNLNTLMLNDNAIESLEGSTYVNDTGSLVHCKNDSMTSHETGISKKSLFSINTLQYIEFNNNKIRDIPRDIKLLNNLRSLSLGQNNIKTIPEEIGELKKLTTLDLSGNELRALPHSIVKFEKQSFMLIIQENFISLNDTVAGLGVESIKKVNFHNLQCNNQYTYITIDEVLNKMEQDDYYWNVDKLKEIKLLTAVSDFSSKISDKQMRKIWRVILKYFIISEHLVEEPDTESSDEINFEVEKQITQIKPSAAFVRIKKYVLTQPKDISDVESTDGYISLSKKVSNFLRNNSLDNTTGSICVNKMHDLLKNSIKALFFKILENIVENIGNFENLELIKLAITDLCENKLFSCIDGQLEGLQYYYSLFYSAGNEVSNNSIQDFIRNLIASLKETTFISKTNGDEEDGVHNISRWRLIFKDMLGILYSFDDPYASKSSVIQNKHKIGSIYNSFFTSFSVDTVCQMVLDKINENSVKVNESLDMLKHIHKIENPIEDDYKIYMNVIKDYFEYETVFGYSELQAKNLKKEGLIKILIRLGLLKINLNSKSCKRFKRA